MTALNVAIAEDNPKTMELLNDMLKNEDGIEVVGNAETGDEAYRMIVNSKPDVVLLDVVMPGMDGVEVMEKVKAEGNLEKNPSYIVVTAGGSDVVTADAFRMGASYFIMKPFKKEVLLDKIHRVGSYGLKPRGLNLTAGARKIKPYENMLDYMEQNLENDITQILHEQERAYQGISVSAGRHHHLRGRSGYADFRDKSALSHHRQEAPDDSQPCGEGYTARHRGGLEQREDGDHQRDLRIYSEQRQRKTHQFGIYRTFIRQDPFGL